MAGPKPPTSSNAILYGEDADTGELVKINVKDGKIQVDIGDVADDIATIKADIAAIRAIHEGA